MTTLVQRSFSGGEVSPAMYARVDVAKYATGLRTMRNFFVMRQGGAASRPGTNFIAEVSNSSNTVRLLPFVFNTSQSYVLEFGNQYMRVYKDGVQMTDVSKTISAVTQANPCVVTTSAAHGFANGQEVVITNTTNVVPGMIQLVGRNFKIANVTTYTFQLNYMDGTPVDSTSFTAFSIALQVSRVYTLATPYAYTDLPLIKFTQSYDVMTLAHPSYSVYELGRLGDADWTLTEQTYTAPVSPPSPVTFGTYSTGSIPYTYAVTSVDQYGNESASTSSSTISCAPPSPTTIHIVNWTAVSGAVSYNIYIGIGGIFALVGSTGTTSFTNGGFEPNSEFGPPTWPPAFLATYPGAVGYFQQRICFAASNQYPTTVWGSETGSFNNFSTHFPIQDNDALQFTLVSKQLNAIQHIVDIGQMVIMTSGGEWVAQGNSNGVITPSEINLRQYSYYGSAPLTPIVIGPDLLFVQARGSIVRDFAFDFLINSYRGNDLTIFSNHLVDGYTIVDWAYAQIPNSIVWMARSDGTLLGLTYIKEQQVLGWHRHDFSGVVENTCVVPEGQEDVLYVVVNRTIDGETKRYIERMNTRLISPTPNFAGTPGIVDYIGMDSTLTYDGRITAGAGPDGGNLALLLTGGTEWAYTETLTCTASTGSTYFQPTCVGNVIEMIGYDGQSIRFKITEWVSDTQVLGNANKTVPGSLQDECFQFAMAVNQVGNLWHLEGMNVSVFADGYVVGSPNNSDYPVYTVTNGTITLDEYYGVIAVGLPITCDLETLDVDTPGFQSISDKKKLVTKVTSYVDQSRGLWAGGAAPDPNCGDVLDGLTELKERDHEDYGEPICLATKPVEINIQGQWNTNGRVFLRQVDPLPLTILSVVPAGHYPIGGA